MPLRVSRSGAFGDDGVKPRKMMPIARRPMGRKKSQKEAYQAFKSVLKNVRKRAAATYLMRGV
jgi:hypothetical protein